MINAIGPYSFVAMSGRLDVPTEQIDKIKRPGVDGIGLWKTGRRAEQSQVRTVIDATTLSEARSKLIDYRSLIGADPVPVIQDDWFFDAANGCRFAVLAVRETQIQEVATICGGLNVPTGDNGAKLVCEWDVIAVETV